MVEMNSRRLSRRDQMISAEGGGFSFNPPTMGGTRFRTLVGSRDKVSIGLPTTIAVSIRMNRICSTKKYAEEMCRPNFGRF